MSFELRVTNTETGEERVLGTYGHIEVDKERAELEVRTIGAPASSAPFRMLPLPYQERICIRAWDGIEKWDDFVPVQKKYVWNEGE